MKRFVVVLVLTLVVFSGCSNGMYIPAATMQVTEPEITEPAATQEITEPVTQPPETEPEHSPLYLPDISVEEVIEYFREVVLSAEFVNGGDPSKVQKWDIEILYMIHGEMTAKDREVLDSFTRWLNEIEGFPGIRETTVDAEANLHIHFCSADRFATILGEDYRGLDGGVTFWYDYDRIYQGTICVRNDMEQELRNSVLQEEIYNGLGPAQDTDLRTDSLIFSGFSMPQSMTDVDELIMKLLYHPQIQCGMDAQQCEAVIRKLYY